MSAQRRSLRSAALLTAGAALLLIGCSGGGGTAVEQSPSPCQAGAAGLPRIDTFTPTAGIEGASVRIDGLNLTGTTLVSIAGLPVLASTLAVNSNCVVTVQAPSPAGTPRLDSIILTTPLGTAVSSSKFFIATGLPTVTGVSPKSGSSLTSLTITGTNLYSAVLVEVGGVSTTPSVATQTQVVALVSSTAVSGGPVRVATPVGSALSATRFVLLTDFAVLASDATPMAPTRFSLAVSTGLGSVWFVDRTSGRNYAARLASGTTPATATLTSFSPPGGLTLNGSVALSSLGSIWVGAGRSLVVLSSVSGSLASLTSISLAGGALQSGRLAVNTLGSVWFTDAAATLWLMSEQGGGLTSYTAPWAGFSMGGRGVSLTTLGSVWTAAGPVLGLLASTATTITSLSLWNGASALDVAVDALGSVWFTDQATPGVLGVRHAAGGAVVSVSLWAGALVSDLAVDAARNVWFTDRAGSSVGLFSADGTLTSYATPTPGAAPGSLAVDRLGSIWYTQLLSIGRLSP